MLTDSSGAAVWRASYEAYGNAKLDPANTVSGFNFRFPGQYYDAESGLHYNRFRYYDADTGRYISADPIGQDGSTNTYSYAWNNPAASIDPLGLLRVPFVGNVNAGESYGEYAAQYWANKSVDPDSSAAEKALAYAMGALASLWTPDTSNDTAAALLAAYGAGKACEALTGDEPGETAPDDKPPGWTPDWEYRYPASDSRAGKRWFDPEGGEWRRNPKDKW